jgi:PKD repeat protein
VTFNTAGTHTVTFTVRDSAGATASATRTITVNRPPVATITVPTGNVTITQGGTVDFAGTGSDPDGNALTYGWTFNGATPSSATVANPSPVTFNSAGSFTTTFTVRDSHGATATASRTVTVTAPSATLTISRAEWDDGELDVRGSGAPAGSTVTIRRTSSTGTIVGTTRASSTGTFRFERDLSSVPCTVWVQAGTRSGVRAVSGAPRSCVR